MQHNTNDPAMTTAHTAATGSNPPSPSGDTMDVMNILADVEKHIQRIKTAQKEHDQELNTLETRFAALKNAEKEVEQRRKQVIEERGRLEQVQNALREEREAFTRECDSRRHDLDHERTRLAEETATLEQRQRDLEQRFHQIEQQFAELSALEQDITRDRQSLQSEQQQTQARHKQLIQQLDDRQAELDQRDAVLSEQRRVLEARHAEINAELERMKGEVKTYEARTVEAERAVAQALEQMRRAEAQLEARSTELNQIRDELGSTHQALTEAREQSARLEREFETEREQATEMMSDLEAQVQAGKRESAELAGELDTLRAKHASLTDQHAHTEELRSQLEQHVTQLNNKLAQRDKALSESQEKLKLAGEKLAEFSEVLREQAAQLEHAAAAKITVRQQQQEIEHLCNELARYRLAADPEVIDRKDQRIAELTEALRQARGQSPTSGDSQHLEQQLIEMNAALDERQLLIEQLQVQLAHAQQRASEEVSAGAKSASDAARLTERDARIEELTAEVHRLSHELQDRASAAQTASTTEAAHAAEIEALQQQVRELEGRTQTAESDPQTLRELEAETARSAHFQQRVKELEHELKKAKKSGSSSGGSTKGLDEKVQRIRAAAEHLQRRRARLQRLRHLIELHKPAGSGHSQSTAEQIELAQQSISEARTALAMSEREMMKRWARSRSAVAVSFATILLAVVGAASWFVADHFYPAKAVAAVSLEARTKTNGKLDGEEGALWSAWHAEMLHDRSFRTTLAKRMQERQLPLYGSESAIDALFKSDVTIDAVQPGELTISMAGHDSRQLIHALDTIASTLSTASAREAGKRTDGARTVIRGEQGSGSSVQYAALTGVTTEDERLMYAGIIFGSTITVALLFGLGIYSRLIKSKRIFEEEGRLT